MDILNVTEQVINVNANEDVIDINVVEEVININVDDATINILSQPGAYPLPSTLFSVFGRVGNVVAQEGDYSLTQLSGVTIAAPSNGQILSYNGSQWVNVTPLTGGSVTSVDMSVPVGLQVSGNPITTSGTLAVSLASGYVIPTQATLDTKQDDLNGTGIVKSTAGTISYLTDNTANWDAAYNDKINSAAVTGTTTKTLTLNQQDGGTITASWTDDNTDAVTSVFGRTGAVVSASGDYTTTQVTEGTNLYYTDARSRNAISETITGINYDNTSGVFSMASGYAIATTASQATWDAAYNDKINSASVTGTTTKTLTLNQQDGGTITASWTDIDTGLTSVGLSMPAAFSVSGSPLINNGTISVTAAGIASQYVRGDGTLADFPTSTGGGSSVSYYLNSSVSQGTIGGVAYRELSKEPIIGAGTDITISANGYVASYITDVNDPDVVLVPGGNFNCEFYFSVNSNNHNPYVYAELYKYDGSTFTLLGSSQSVPEYLSNGTTLSPYYFAIPVATAALTITDRLAIRIYVNVDGRVVTLHTENGHLCQVVTTLSKGMVSLNNLTDQSQFLTTGTSGTDFNIVSSGDTHTFNIPSASNNNRGLITNLAQTIGGIKTFSSNINADSGIRLKNGVAPSANGYVGIGSNTQGLTLGVYDSGSAYYHELYFPYTNGYQYTFPATSGTLALTSNLSSYVPYTGATANVNLGLNNLTANNVFGETSLNIKVLPSGSVFSTGYSTLSSLAGKFTMAQEPTSGNLKAFTFDFSAWAANTSRTYTLPDLSGTLALLEGSQTFSGSKTFSVTTIQDAGIVLKDGVYPTPSTGYVGFASNGAGVTIVRRSGVTSYNNNFQFPLSSNDYNFPNITGTLALLEGTQTFSGAKTFSAIAKFDGSLLLKDAATISTTSGYGALNFVKATTQSSLYLTSDTGYTSALIFNNASSYNYTYPASSGTIALTSNLSDYVTLATTQTISGQKTFSALSNFDNVIRLKQNLGSYTTDAGYTTLFSTQGSGIYSFGFYNGVGVVNFLDFSTTTGYRYTFPNATGTLALTSDLSAYLPLAGGTLTGALIGTTSSFSGTVSSIVTSGGTSFRVVNSVNSRAWSLIPSTNGAESDLWLYYGGTGGGTKVAFANNGNVGIGLTNPIHTLDVNGTSRVSGVLTLSSTISNGTYTYTLPSATGTLALTSAIPANPVGGTGTTNYLPKFTSASTIGDSVVYESSGSVYLGTAYVLNRTNTGGYFTGVSDNFGFTYDGTAANISNGSATPMKFFTSGALKMTLDASGNLGLGVTPSAWVSYPAMQFTNNFSISALGTSKNAYFDGTDYRYITTSYASLFQQTSGGVFAWFNAPSGTAGNAISFTQAMTLDASGNLFVGVASGSNTAGFTNKVYVEGSLPSLTLSNTGASTGKFTIGVTAGCLGIWNNGTSTYPIFINSTNNIGIGTTTDAGYKLDVNGTGRFSGAVTIGASSLITGSDRILELRGPGSNNSALLRYSDGATAKYSVGFNNNEYIIFDDVAGVRRLQIASTGAATFSSSVSTGAPSGGTAKPWKLGAYQTNTVIFDTAHYVQVEIDGVAYRLALAL